MVAFGMDMTADEAAPPKTRPEFWMPKLAANKARDARKSEELSALGWRVAVVWQCELDNPEALSDRLVQLLTSESAQQDCTK